MPRSGANSLLLSFKKIHAAPRIIKMKVLTQAHLPLRAHSTPDNAVTSSRKDEPEIAAHDPSVHNEA